MYEESDHDRPLSSDVVYHGTITILVQMMVPVSSRPHTMNRPEFVVNVFVLGQLVMAASATGSPCWEYALTRATVFEEIIALIVPAVPFAMVTPQFTGDAPQAFSVFTVDMKFSK